MNKYNKLIVALVGAVVSFIGVFFNSPEWLQIIVPVLTAAGVYQVPNKVK